MSSSAAGGGGGVPALLAPHAAGRTRSLSEAHILHRVGDGHPNVCRYRSCFVAPAPGFSSSESGGDPRHDDAHEMLCIVMDFYAGGDLSKRIKQKVKQIATTTITESARGARPSTPVPSSAQPLSPSLALPAASTAISHAPPLFPEDTVLDYLVQLCLGVKHIHDSRLLHRDLKPSNIFISLEKARSFHRDANTRERHSTGGVTASERDPTAHRVVEVLRIGDFGIARLLDSSSALAHTRLGTPYFLAPEVVEGRAYSRQADIWVRIHFSNRKRLSAHRGCTPDVTHPMR